MIFDSSLLKEQSIENPSRLSLENSIENNDRSIIPALLEFNDTMHAIDVEEKINYYRALAEASSGKCTDLVLQEGIVSSVFDFLSNAIQAILDLFGKFIGFFKNLFTSESYKASENSKKEFDSVKTHIDPNSNLDQVKELKVFVRPSLDKISDNYIAPSINGLIDAFNGLLEGREINDSFVDSQRQMAFTLLNKLVVRNRNTYNNKIVDSKSFRECVQADSCYIETKSMKVYEYLNTYWYMDREIGKKAAAKVELLKKRVSDAKSKLDAHKGTLNDINRNVANKIISYCNEICNNITWYLDSIVKMEAKNSNYCSRLYNGSKTDNVSESGFIHGEEFNGDTLFDNEDARDFNRTEWLDLQLTAESYEISSAVLEYKRRVALQEAIIFSENSVDTFHKLVAMKEAETTVLKNKFQDIIKAISDAINTFLTNLRDKLSFEANYVKKYKDIILNKPLKITTVSSTGDITSGITRISQKTNIDPYDYERMKEDLEYDKTFFQKYILPSMINNSSKRKVSFNSDKMSVAEYCKIYFGASMPEDKYPKLDFNAAEILAVLPKVVEFLEAPNALMNNIKSELAAIKNQANKAAAEEGHETVVNQKQLSSGEAKPTIPEKSSANITKESMYYSELYGRWFTEAEISGTADAPGNVEKAEQKEQGKQVKGGFKSYINAYRQVITAKLTGAQFVRSEFMAIIRHQVKAYGGKDIQQNAVNNDQNNQQQTVTTTKQTQTTVKK